MRCAQCQTDNPEQARFCLNCGSRLILACPQCGQELPPGARFCFACGAAVSAPPPVSPPSHLPAGEKGRGEESRGAAPPADVATALQRLIPKEYAERLRATRGRPSGERRIVTILFADVKSSTAMAATMDPEDWMEIMNGALESLIAPVYRYEGTLARLMGDAILAFFGAPLSHEDDPERALCAALDIVAGAQEYAARLEREKGLRGFNVRVGINTGLVVVGEVGSDLRVEYTAMGDAVNLAARMEQNAPPGGILITHDTYQHVRGLFDVAAQPPLTVKGKSEPIQTYLVLRARPHGFYTSAYGIEGLSVRMVGRERELRLLQEAFAAAMAGRTQFVTVVGEAGVGKSRLLLEFEDWLLRQSEPLLYLRGRATPVGAHIPYSLLRDLFRERFDIADSDPLPAVRAKIEEGFQPYLDADRAHLVGQLIGFDLSTTPAVQNLSGSASFAPLALAYLGNYFRGLTADHATAILLEDLHWADTSSLDFLAHLVEDLPDRRLLVIGLARPAVFERPSLPLVLSPAPPVGGGEKGPGEGKTRGSGEVLTLKPLSPADSYALVEEILQKVEDIPADLRDMVVQNAEGNPFYVEELIKMLIDDGVIVPGAERWSVEMEQLKRARVPPTLQGVLQARLDSLPPAEKSLLQRASVVGREFWDAVLETMASGEEPIAAELEAVHARQMIFPRPYSAFRGTQEYRFKHALLRDTTYETVLLRLRRAYHRQVAAWLEDHVGERLNEYAGLVADHYERAGEQARALEWLRRAGRAAWEVSAFCESLHFFKRALALVPDEERAGRVDLLQWIGECQDKLGDYPAARSNYQQALDLAREIGAWETAAGALGGLSWLAQVQGDRDAAQAYARESLEAARRAADPRVYGRALMRWSAYQENDADSLRLLEECLDIFRQHGLRTQEAVCQLNMGNLTYEMRDMDAAGRHYAESLAIFRQIGNRWGMANCLGNLGMVFYWQGDYPAALEHCQEYLNISREIGDREGIALSTNSLGHVLIPMGRHEEALAWFRKSIPECRALGLTPIFLDIAIGVARIEAEAGRGEQAAQLLGLALAHPAYNRELEMFAEPVLALLRQKMAAAELEAALERGKGLDLEAVMREVESSAPG